mgnify:CR=1 FL=1
MKKISEKTFTSQTISPPIILTLNQDEVQALETYEAQLSMFGYEIEPFGGKEYAITAIPADFTDIDMKTMFIEMLDDFANISGKDAPNLIMEKVASMSCKAAVKGNNHLSRPEIGALIDELLELDNPYNCPHGRPTIISMTKYENRKEIQENRIKIMTEKRPMVILTGPTAVGKQPCPSSLQKNQRIDHLRRLHAGIPAYGYRLCKGDAGRDEWCQTLPDR